MYSVNFICAEMVITAPLAVVIVVSDDIEVKIAQCLAGSFYSKDFEVTWSLHSEVPPSTVNGVEF